MELEIVLRNLLAAIEPDQQNLVRLWHQYNKGVPNTVPPFTQRWTASDGIFARLASQLDLRYQPEGMNRIDAVLMSPNDCLPKVLIEHENKKPTAVGEVLKLAPIPCPIRIVITYPWTKVLDRMDQEAVDFASECGAALQASGVADGSLVIVFGVLRVDSIEWRMFLWGDAAFDEFEA